jgi:glycosyltransferase involved in cell wall biosynthesis
LLCDARWAGSHGIGRFASEVLRRLPEHRQLARGPKPLSAADPLWLACQVAARRPRLYFSPGFNPPPLGSTPFVFTIHDLIHIQVPAEATLAKHLYYRLVVKPACRRARRVLTVSEYSRAQILRWADVQPERVVNVGNGVGPPFEPEGPRRQTGSPYVLYVGNSRPHKGLLNLLLAFRGIAYPDLRLVLAGRLSAEIGRRADSLGIGHRTEIIDAPSDEDLACLYRGARLLVLPSLVEGFGLPALEAMACGTPVIASRAAALPEVVGEAGALVDPLDVAAIQREMESVLGSAERQAAMRAKGIERARQFTWDKVAAKVRGVLFCSWHIGQTWKELGGRRAALAESRRHHLDNLQTLTDLTQQVYLELPDPRARFGQTPPATSGSSEQTPRS